MVASASVHHGSSDAKQKHTMLLASGFALAIGAGAAVGYLAATPSLPDCCTVTATGKQGVKNPPAACVEKPKGTKCEID
jgi:hypothetical protein